jgi:hypothetical protein
MPGLEDTEISEAGSADVLGIFEIPVGQERYPATVEGDKKPDIIIRNNYLIINDINRSMLWGPGFIRHTGKLFSWCASRGFMRPTADGAALRKALMPYGGEKHLSC